MLQLNQFYFLINYVVPNTVLILIRWLLQNPANMNLRCFQVGIYLVAYCFQVFGFSFNTSRTALNSFYITCSLGQEKFFRQEH